MSKPTNDLLSVSLNAIASHRELIQQVYINGRYTRNGSKTDRDAYILAQSRIFVADGRDSYRLSRVLAQFFDEVTQKQNLFELLGDIAGAQVNRISQLINEYGNAVVDGSIDDADRVSAQFHDACADLSDTFSRGISKLFNQAETNFAVVSTIEAKSRQNEHYLLQTKRFSDALNSLNKMGIESQLSTENCDFEPLAQHYCSLISDRKAEWHTEISRLLRLFETYLYRLRDIAPDVKRFRQFANFIQQNPGYELPDLEDTHHRPLWMMRASGIATTAYSDVCDRDSVEYLREIAIRLPAPKEPVTKDRRPGVIERKSDRPPETLATKPYHLALIHFAKAASLSPAPLSALKWKREHGAGLCPSDEVWLMQIIHSKNNPDKPFDSLNYHRIEYRGESPISRNLFIQDVMVHGS